MTAEDPYQTEYAVGAVTAAAIMLGVAGVAVLLKRKVVLAG